jgi:drug/metabolite transporter (DMT)-like permease
MPPTRALVPLALAVTVLLWGSAFAGIRFALPAFGFGALAGGRLLIAAGAFALIGRLTGKVARAERGDLPLLAALGATGYAGYQLLLCAGEERVPGGAAALLFAAAPVFAAVLARPVLGERLSGRRAGGLGVALAGAALLGLGEGASGGDPAGVALVLAATAVYALWIVLQKRALRRMTPLQVTAYGAGFGALFALPFTASLPHALISAPPSALLALLLLGAVITTVPFLLWAWVLERLPANVASVSLLLISPAGALIGWAWLGEAPAAVTLLGGAVTLAGVGIVNLAPATRSKPRRALLGRRAIAVRPAWADT